MRPVVSLVCLVCLCGCAGLKTIRLGLLNRLSATGVSHDDHWKGVACSAIIAVRHANERDGSIAPALADLKRTRFEYYEADTRSSAVGAIEAQATLEYMASSSFGGDYNELVDRGEPFIHAIVGPSSSAECQAVALSATVDHSIHMGYWATSPACASGFDRRIFVTRSPAKRRSLQLSLLARQTGEQGIVPLLLAHRDVRRHRRAGKRSGHVPLQLQQRRRCPAKPPTSIDPRSR